VRSRIKSRAVPVPVTTTKRTAPGGLSKKLHVKAAAQEPQSITLVNQRVDERKIVVLRSDASDKTANHNESDDHYRLAENPSVDTLVVNTRAFSGTDSQKFIL
jgi:hypothetical protein